MQFLAINMFPVVMLILPLFVLLRQFGLLDTYFALIAGHATFTLPFAIWLHDAAISTAFPPISTTPRPSTAPRAGK